MEDGGIVRSDRAAGIHTHSAELIRFRDERKSLTFTLTNGETVEGFIRWFDDEAIHVVVSGAERSEVTLFKHAVIRYQTQ